MNTVKQTIACMMILMSCLSINACATDTESIQQKTEKVRFLIGFLSKTHRANAQQQRQSTLESWQSLCSCNIQYLRSMSIDLWLIEVEIHYTDELTLRKAKQNVQPQITSQDNIRYVEEDQIIQLDPIEQPKYPVRVH